MKIRSVKTKLLLLFIPVSVVLLVVAAIIIGSIARNVTFALAQSSAEETLNATVRNVGPAQTISRLYVVCKACSAKRLPTSCLLRG